MKILLNTFFVCLAGLSLTACTDGLGNFDDAPPYAIERTAQHEAAAQPVAAPAAEAPMCKACTECSDHKSQIAALEAELATCREASNRVRDAYQDELKK